MMVLFHMLHMMSIWANQPDKAALAHCGACAENSVRHRLAAERSTDHSGPLLARP